MGRAIFMRGPKLILALVYLTANLTGGLLATSRLSEQRPEHKPMYLESMEDLEHVAYLSLANFNITEELLSQTNWRFGLGNGVVFNRNRMLDKSPADRLAFMLESFIIHLRSGRLRRPELAELAESVQRITNSLEGPGLAADLGWSLSGTKNASNSNQDLTVTTVAVPGESNNLNSTLDPKESQWHEHHERCKYLVQIYKYELAERASVATKLAPLEVGEASSSAEPPLEPSNERSHHLGEQEQEVELPAQAALQVAKPADDQRLMQLCRLVVGCQPGERLVNLITGPWAPNSRSLSGRQVQSGKSGEPTASGADMEPAGERDDRPSAAGADSLSLSLAKLCPLLLFQLHEDDGLCNGRRDDQPPMVTVWAFASLFVTIVCFCSLIGLSITPLLGLSVAGASTSLSDGDEVGSWSKSRRSPFSWLFGGALHGSTSSGHASNSSGPSNDSLNNKNNRTTSNRSRSTSSSSNSGASQSTQSLWANLSKRAAEEEHHRQHQRACLNLFEGLAVGSMAGSALFSLIPQAFELQERESNQGFLLKALIIFFGIYLFFLSERLMRLILDARQQRKRNKHLIARRSSNSLPQLSVDHHHHHHHHPHHHHHHHQQQQQQQLQSSSIYHQAGQPQSLEAGPQRSTGTSARNSQVCRPTVAFLPETSGQQKGQQVPKGRSSHQYKNHNSKDAHGQHETSQVAGHQRSSVHRKHQQAASSSQPSISSHPATGAAKQRNSSAKSQTRPSRQATRRRQARGRLLASKPRRSGLGVERRARRRSRRCPTRRHASPGSSVSSRSVLFAAKPNNEADRPLDHVASLDDSPLDESQSFLSEAESSWSELDQRRVDATDHHPSDLKHHDGCDAIERQQTSDTIYSRQANSKLTRKPENIQTVEAHTNDQLHKLNLNSRTLVHDHEQDISTVAWMIILGDALHNFIDGISIGAAFSESILSGVSISVAVICEELPHELGDFAVLVSSGMTVRQALGYNFLSACTCYLGMAVGIIIGDVSDGASYISAAAAGVFLYIALVDMMGELSATLEEASRDSIGKTLKLLLLQNVGIFIGISIILVLSFIDF